MLQAGVPRGRHAADVGGVLGSLPDRLLPSVHCRSADSCLRGGRHTAGLARRRDTPTLQQSIHAHECPSHTKEGLCFFSDEN